MSEEQGAEFEEAEKPRRWITEFWEIIKILTISVAIVLPIRFYIAQPFIVRGASMEPNFENSQYLIIDEFTYHFREPKRGEAIVFRYPRDPRQFFIKRIIGLPRERIEIKKGVIKVFNSFRTEGFMLEESYLRPLGRPTFPDLSTILEENEYFVLGDNRDASSDSRIWGKLERRLITGRAVFRVFPFYHFGTIPNYSFE